MKKGRQQQRKGSGKPSWEKFKAKWSNCQLCDLRYARKNVVLARGFIPCQVLFIGEAPGNCITGGSRVAVAYRDYKKFPIGVPIRDLAGQSGFYVYSYDARKDKLALGKVKKVWKTGIRPVYRVKYFWWGARRGGGGGRQKYYGQLRVTSNHPFMLRDGKYLSIAEGLDIGDRLMPFYQGKDGGVRLASSRSILSHRLLAAHKLGRELESWEDVHHKNRNHFDNSWDNLEVLTIEEHARLHGFEDNPMFVEEHKETHRKVMSSRAYSKKMSRSMRRWFSNPNNYQRRLNQIYAQRDQTSETVKALHKDPAYRYRYLLGRQKRHGWNDEEVERRWREQFPDLEFPPREENHEIYSIESDGRAAVFDMEVLKYHNFATEGIFVHNSEDVLGSPFVGPAGHLLDSAIDWALGLVDEEEPARWKKHRELKICQTNVICCIPKQIVYDETEQYVVDVGKKVDQPPDWAIEACAPRLQEFYQLAKPAKVVLVGRISEKWASKFLDLPMDGAISITHPAAILRANPANQGLAFQRMCVQLEDLFEEM